MKSGHYRLVTVCPGDGWALCSWQSRAMDDARRGVSAEEARSRIGSPHLVALVSQKQKRKVTEMKLQRKVALVMIMAVLLLSFGAVRFALAVGSDLKEAASEIQTAQTLLTKANSDWQAMENKMRMMKNSKEDLRDMGTVMEMQAAVQNDFAQASQHILNAVEVIEKHFNK